MVFKWVTFGNEIYTAANILCNSDCAAPPPRPLSGTSGNNLAEDRFNRFECNLALVLVVLVNRIIASCSGDGKAFQNVERSAAGCEFSAVLRCVSGEKWGKKWFCSAPNANKQKHKHWDWGFKVRELPQRLFQRKRYQHQPFGYTQWFCKAPNSKWQRRCSSNGRQMLSELARKRHSFRQCR